MKVSSISGNSLETDFIEDHQDITFFQAVQNHAASLLEIVDRIGTSIAMGENGDLDAAHEFRNREPGNNT
jgi:hypothetical protein